MVIKHGDYIKSIDGKFYRGEYVLYHSAYVVFVDATNINMNAVVISEEELKKNRFYMVIMQKPKRECS